MQADDPPEMQAIRLGPTHLPGALTRREVVQHYIADTDLTLDEMHFYLVYGLFRLAGIVQQIYYRYYHGQTQDERFRHFGQVVAGLERAGRPSAGSGQTLLKDGIKGEGRVPHSKALPLSPLPGREEGKVGIG